MADTGFVGGLLLACAVGIALVTVATLALIRIGGRRWRVVGEGVVDRTELHEVPAGVTPMENGFISPPVSMNMVRFADGSRVEIPHEQVSRCEKGKRIRVSRNWLGELRIEDVQ